MRPPFGHAGARKRWYWLLLLPFVCMLWPPLYARVDPMLAGIPFFYWYQFVWVILSAVVTGLVYWLSRD
jgi:hypothetical protein